VKFASDRLIWSTWSNFKNMYDNVYNMVEAGVAEVLHKPIWVNMHGDDSFERKVTH